MKEKQILFLCVGNTCRSPMAEFICKRKAKLYNIHSLKIISAGFCVDMHSHLNRYTEQCLLEANFDIENFIPKQIGHQMLCDSDIIFCMTENQKRMLEDVYTGIYSSVDFIGRDIEDPWGEGLEAYKFVYSQIEEVCDKLLQKIQENKL